MKIQTEGSIYPITIEDIESFEKKYELNLPQDYKDFLLTNNGGKPCVRRFKTENGKVVSSFMYIMPLTKSVNDSEAKHNLGYSYIRYVVSEKMPRKLLPFGETLKENILCISIAGDDYGSVYFWDREEELVQKVPQPDCYHIISDNFSGFINGLRENDEQLA